MSKESELCDACYLGNKSRVVELLTAGADPNSEEAVDKDGMSPLHYACQHGWLDIIHLLIEKYRCNTNVATRCVTWPCSLTKCWAILTRPLPERDEHLRERQMIWHSKLRPLHYACRYGHYEIALQLIKTYKCDPNIQDLESGMTPLHFACIYEKYELAKLLINEKVCDLNVKDKFGHIPLHYAFSRAELDYVTTLMTYLIANGSELNTIYSEGDTLLHVACEAGTNLKSLKFLWNIIQSELSTENKTVLALLQVNLSWDFDIIFKLTVHGACPCVIDSEGNTLLHKACCSISCTSMLHYTLKTILYLKNKAKCDPKSKNKLGLTSLQVTPSWGSDIMQKFIERGGYYCDKSSDSDGNTPLHRACELSELERVTLLLNVAKCDPNARNKFDLTPLQVIPFRVLTKKLSYKCGCLPNARIRCGLTPLKPNSYRSVRNSGIVKELIAHGANPNVVYNDGYTPLHDACQLDLLATVKHLLYAPNCDTNAKDEYGRTPLHVAHNTCIVQELIMRGANPNVKDYDGNTPLHYACESNELDNVNLILNAVNCDPNAENKSGRTPLQFTLFDSNNKFKVDITVKSVMHELIKHGAKPSITDSDGNSLLHTACEKNALLKTVQYLLNAVNCDPNAKNKSGLTPLQVTSPDNLGVIKELITHGADPNVTDSNGNTLLHSACKENALETVKHLLKAVNCDPNTKNKSGLTPLQVTLLKEADTSGVIQELITHGANRNVAYNDGNTLLHRVCETSYSLRTVKILLNADCDPNVVNKSGLTPLQVTSLDNIDVIRELITHGANPNVTDDDGNTPLHQACKRYVACLNAALGYNPNARNNFKQSSLLSAPLNHGGTLQKVVTRGAISNVTNSDNNTLKVHRIRRMSNISANYHNLLETIELLLNAKPVPSNPNAKNNSGLTPLQDTCSQFSWSAGGLLSIHEFLIILELITHGAYTNHVTDAEGNTLLHYACRYNEDFFVKCLLKVDCNPNARNKAGLTPLKLTTDTGIIRELIRHGANPKNVYRAYQSILKQPLQPPVKMFIVGNPSVGKSTLTAAIQEEYSFLKRAFKAPKKVEGVDTKTAGVIPHDFDSREYGSAIIYDFAGQREFYSSHAAVLQSTIQSYPPIFIIVIDLRENEEQIIQTVLYWLTFLENQCSSVSSKPHVIIVGSHADVLKEKEDIESKIKCLQLEMFSQFVFAGFIAMDCQYPESPGMDELRQCLKGSCNALRSKETITFNAHCFHVYLVDNFKDRIAVTVKEIQAQIMEDSNIKTKQSKVLQFLPDSLNPLLNICDELNNRGHILFLKASKVIEESWIVIDKKSLLGQISGSIFSPEHFKQYKEITQCPCSTGVVPLSSIIESFPDHNPELLIKFLSSLEFCHEIYDPDILHCITAEHQTCVVTGAGHKHNERYFLFPALVSLKVPTNIWDDKPEYTHHCGWIVHCSTEMPQHFFTSRFLQVLLLRLAFAFPLSEGVTLQSHPAIQRNCSIWKNGIFWANDNGVETLAEVLSDN